MWRENRCSGHFCRCWHGYEKREWTRGIVKTLWHTNDMEKIVLSHLGQWTDQKIKSFDESQNIDTGRLTFMSAGPNDLSATSSTFVERCFRWHKPLHRQIHWYIHDHSTPWTPSTKKTTERASRQAPRAFAPITAVRLTETGEGKSYNFSHGRHHGGLFQLRGGSTTHTSKLRTSRQTCARFAGYTRDYFHIPTSSRRSPIRYGTAIAKWLIFHACRLYWLTRARTEPRR